MHLFPENLIKMGRLTEIIDEKLGADISARESATIILVKINHWIPILVE